MEPDYRIAFGKIAPVIHLFNYAKTNGERMKEISLSEAKDFILKAILQRASVLLEKDSAVLTVICITRREKVEELARQERWIPRER